MCVCVCVYVYIYIKAECKVAILLDIPINYQNMSSIANNIAAFDIRPKMELS